jgi:hypothetical protein
VARLVPENMKLFIVFQVIGYDHLFHPHSNQSCLLNKDSECGLLGAKIETIEKTPQVFKGFAIFLGIDIFI